MTERITLEVGDVFRETIQREGHAPISFIRKVDIINTDGEGSDYLHSVAALDESEVPSSSTLYLDPGEKNGETAVIPAEFTTLDGILNHKIEKAKAPVGVRWSYNG